MGIRTSGQNFGHVLEGVAVIPIGLATVIAAIFKGTEIVGFEEL